LILAASYYTKISFRNYLLIDLMLILPTIIILFLSLGVTTFSVFLAIIPALTFNLMDVACKFIRNRFTKDKAYS